MSALQEAQRLKHEIEESLADRLQGFTEDTGLAVTDIDLERINVTEMGDEAPQFRYRINLDIRVE